MPLKEKVQKGQHIHYHGFKSPKGFWLLENPLKYPPLEIIEQGDEAILAYFHNLEEQGTQQLNEAKLIIVGEPEAGKTSLMETLLNPKFELTPDTETTLGVEVREGWQFPHPQKPDTTFTTNIWDFGGQQIQYMTHQFFLTPGAAYVLVSANDRKEPTNFPYWFKIIHLLGEERGVYSPVLVVLNEKDDKFINKFNFDRKFYEERYPELQISVCEVNLDKRDGQYQALRDTIQGILTQLPHVTSERPARWNDIRDSLRERAKTDDHISFAQYAEICEQHKVTDEQSQLLFSRYLHRLGSLLHFSEDPTLHNFIILNPQWAVDAVHSVLNDNTIANSGGHFTRKQVETIWKAKLRKNGQPKYNYDERNKLISLMEKENFEICYPLDADAKCYIAPQLLNAEQPDYAWGNNDNLKFRFQYKFMPEGILTRLIVRLNAILAKDSTGKQLVWQKGAIFNSEECQAQVEEEENRDGLKIIDIAINGKASERKFLLRQIRNEISDIHHKWFRNIQSEQMIPCICRYCVNPEHTDQKFFEFSVLKRAQEHGKAKIECDKEFLDVSVIGLLEGVFISNDIRQQQGNIPIFHENQDYPDTETIDIFISYSTKNRIYAAQLAQYLENSGYSVWRDTNLLAGDHFRSEIQAQLVAAKCTVVLWSEHAVKSEWVQEEAGYAHSEKKLIPTKLDTTELPMPFGGLQTISLENWHGDQNDPCLAPLLHAIKKKMGK